MYSYSFLFPPLGECGNAEWTSLVGGYLESSTATWVLPGHLDTPRDVMIKMVLPTGDLLLPGRWVLAVPGLPGSGGRRVPSDKMSCTESTSPQIHGLPNGF